jgi:hypothetical protein
MLLLQLLQIAMAAAAKPRSRARSALLLIFCVAGIYSAYLTQGRADLGMSGRPEHDICL